jgi:hypothetical protein
MKYLTSSTTAVSFVIALVLFVVASLIDGDREPPTPPPPEKTPSLITQVRPDSAVRDELAMQGCREAEESLKSRLDASQYCVADEDCTIFDYGYPIQCLTSVTQSEVSALRMEYRNYEQSCAYRVYYDCPSEPLERHAVCRNNRCAVELRTLDLLRDQTLRHLGIDPDAQPGATPDPP